MITKKRQWYISSIADTASLFLITEAGMKSFSAFRCVRTLMVVSATEEKTLQTPLPQ